MSKHTATIVDEKGSMLVFGGYGNQEGNVYSLDLTSMNWSSIDNVKYERWGHSADLIGNSIYLFGGYCAGERNDIHKYDLDKTLKGVKTTGQIPSARMDHGSAVIQQNLYIFGGWAPFSYETKDHTLYSLNTNTKEWTTIPSMSDAFP